MFNFPLAPFIMTPFIKGYATVAGMIIMKNQLKNNKEL